MIFALNNFTSVFLFLQNLLVFFLILFTLIFSFILKFSGISIYFYNHLRVFRQVIFYFLILIF
jgi:hypothetical protein